MEKRKILWRHYVHHLFHGLFLRMLLPMRRYGMNYVFFTSEVTLDQLIINIVAMIFLSRTQDVHCTIGEKARYAWQKKRLLLLLRVNTMTGSAL